MKNVMWFGLGFATSVASFCIGVYLGDKSREEYYRQQADKAVENEREFYRARLDRMRNKYEGMLAERDMTIVQEAVRTEESQLEEAADAALESYQGIVATPAHDYTQHVLQGPAPAETTVLVAPDPNAPRIVEEPFHMAATDTYSFTFYVPDNVIIDEDYAPITDKVRGEVLGELDGHLLGYVNPEGNIFVYAPRLRRSFQIHVETDISYADDILAGESEEAGGL